METAFITGNASKEDIMKDAETLSLDMNTVNIKNKDDVLTYMIHLGYLGYNENKKTAFVPNEEIRQELTVAVESKLR